MDNVAVGLDFGGNRGRDQMRQIDISEGPPGANGRIVRLRASQFDPDGTLIPAAARNTNFLRVLQNQISFRAYSGYPINETIGTDVNGDRDNTDRPVRGVHDLTRPILSEVDNSGRAIRNGIDGNGSKLPDLSAQYVQNPPGGHTAGFFWEMYNVMNWVNLGNPTGNRNNANFMRAVVAGRPLQMQVGVRYTF